MARGVVGVARGAVGVRQELWVWQEVWWVLGKSCGQRVFGKVIFGG